MVASSSFKSIDNNVLSRHQIESTFCVKEEDERRFFRTEQGVIERLREEECSKFMAGPVALELGACLYSCPATRVELTNIAVQGLGQQRAGRDGPIGAVRLLVFAVTFPQDARPDSIELLEGGKVDLVNDDIEEEVEVLQALEPSINEVGGSDGEVVINISFQGVEQLSGVLGGDGGNFAAMSCNLQNIFVVEEC